MYTTIILLIFIAFLILYNTSMKSRWADKPLWADNLEKQKMLSGVISGILLVIACSLLVYDNGITSGMFSFIVILMSMGSLIVLLFPFRYLSARQTVLLFLLFAVFEQLIF
jgi:hypothetical protein